MKQPTNRVRPAKLLGSALVLCAASCISNGLESLEEVCLVEPTEAPGSDQTSVAWATGGIDATVATISDDGAWCWFQDERAIFVGDRLLAGSVSGDGDVQVSSYDFASRRADHFVLAPDFDRDDHAAPALQQLDDGRVRAVYTEHNGPQRMLSRTTAAAGGEIGTWSPPQSFTAAPDDDVCYANVLSLAGESRDGPRRLYLFFRGVNYNPTFMVSDDGGETWTGRSQLLSSWEPAGPRRGNHRPYVKYVSDGEDTIHFFYTEGHPDECNLDNECLADSVYHMYYRDGSLYRSDGAIIATMTPGEDVAIDPTLGTRVYDGRCGVYGEAWVWDIALDDAGRPAVVFASFPDRHDVQRSHVYHWARWDGDRWQRRVIGHGGTALYEDQPFYSGGIALDPDDTSVVYLSSNVNPINGLPLGTGHYEIYRARATDESAHDWQLTAVTASSSEDNLRPVVPSDHPFETAVLWMRGEYRTYTDYDTQIVGLFGDPNVIARAR